MTLIELLKAGRIQEFNAKRGQRVTIDLYAADLTNLPLAGIDLSRANMEKADFTGSDLTGANLSQGNLDGADFTGAILDRVVAIRARMRDAYLGEARAEEIELSGADLSHADLTGLHAPRARLTGARLKETILTNAMLAEANLTDARMANADLRGADLSGARLNGAELTGANCGGARFERAVLDGAHLAGANLRSCNLANASLVEADLTGVDLTGSRVDGANFDKADLFDVQADLSALRQTQVAREDDQEDDEAGPIELHFEDPSVAVGPKSCAVLWENADGEDVLTLRVMICPMGGKPAGASTALPVPTEQVVSRAILPRGDGFLCVLFVERPGGVECVSVEIAADGSAAAPKGLRLGYAPVVKPVIASDGGAPLLYGIGRQGVLSVHRLEADALTELLRAPATTYRGFCGRYDPVLLGKGGTLAAVRQDGIGRLLTAPTGYPGRLCAAAIQPEGDKMGLAWTQREERGFRFAMLPDEPAAIRVDPRADIGGLDIIGHQDRWLVIYLRESDVNEPMGAWFPGGAPFSLLRGEKVEELEDLRFAWRQGAPCAVLVGGDGTMLVVEVGATSGKVIARFGGDEA